MNLALAKIPSRLDAALDAIMGNGVIRCQTVTTIEHLSAPDANGVRHLVKHPNKLKAMLGFHDVRRVKNKCVTTAFVTFVCAQLETETSAFGDFKYHDSGIGTGDEAVGDTGLGTPWGGARDVGTQVPSAGTYTSVATTTYNATKAITEHGLFNASSSGTLMDRTKFAAVNVVSGEAIQFTFVITLTAGG